MRTRDGPYTFAQIRSALANEPHSGSDAIAIAHLPSVDPIPGTHAYYMTSAQAKALALAGPSDALDGTVQFADNPPFDYDRSDGITPGSYDFYGTVAHEFSEVMGRELNAIGNEVQTGKPDGYYPSGPCVVISGIKLIKSICYNDQPVGF